jgi:hypothetical protein
MFRLRPILLAIACCLTLVVPAQASAMLDGIGPKCRALQEKLVEMTEKDQLPGENEAAIAVCIGIQAIAPRGIDVPFAVFAEVHTPSKPARLVIAKRPSGIERPPRA